MIGTTLDKKLIADNFVEDMHRMSLVPLSRISADATRKVTLNTLGSTLGELCSLRLLFLTGNITEDDFIAKGKPLNQKEKTLVEILNIPTEPPKIK